jgi:hypothetical protein
VERRWDLAVTCLLSRRPNVAGIDLSRRVRDAVERRAAPGAHPGVDIMKRKSLQAYVTFFWRGRPGAASPSIPSVSTSAFSRLPADIEADIETDEC